MMHITQLSERQSGHFFFLIRLILFVLIAGLCVFQLFISFRGLNQPVAMDQAQIARQIARGEGRTTKFFRPLDVMQQYGINPETRTQEGLKPSNSGKMVPDFNHYLDAQYAPLHTYMLATALKLTGYNHFDAKRMDAEISNIYGGDRVVAAVSMVFFGLSLVLAYFLFAALFDDVVAATTVAFLGLSQLMLNFAVSGLAQPMLMCLLLGVAGFTMLAIKAQNNGKTYWAMGWNCLAYVLVILMCLSHSMCAWIAAGLIIFNGIYFRPAGIHAIIGGALLVVGYLIPIYFTYAPMGGMVTKFLNSIYFAFGSDSGLQLERASSLSALPFSSANFYLHLLGYAFDTLGNVFTYTGGIIVAPLFLLAIFNRYRKSTCEGVKWAVVAMWIGACLGMAAFARSGKDSPDQLLILFAPFFTAYGTAMVFNILGRSCKEETFRPMRALVITVLLLVSSGSLLFQLPQNLSFSILTSNRGIPNYPPYYPAALNGKLYNMTNPSDIIMTDQPWAVAWYADRKALWLPRSLDTYYRDLTPVLDASGEKLQGVLITPTSHTMAGNGMAAIMSQNADFAPLVLEGKLLQLAPKHNMAFVELFNTQGASQIKSRPLASLVSTQGEFAHRNFLLGADIVYYSRDLIDTPQK